MPSQPMRGVYPILVTPFDEEYQIDEDSLRNLVEFNLAAGVHGLGIALGSEIFKFSESEREQLTQIVVDQVSGRVPVVVNSGASGTDLALHYSRMAEANGADAIMLMPPSFMPIGSQEILNYFKSISEAIKIPIFIQDTSAAHVSASLALQIAEACKQVHYIKVESMPITSKVAEVVAAAGDQLVVFGGGGGNYFVEEMWRGSQGTMPFSSQPEAFVEVWNLFQKGDESAAREVFKNTILPVNRLVEQSAGIYYSIHKR